MLLPVAHDDDDDVHDAVDITNKDDADGFSPVGEAATILSVIDENAIILVFDLRLVTVDAVVGAAAVFPVELLLPGITGASIPLSNVRLGWM